MATTSVHYTFGTYCPLGLILIIGGVNNTMSG